MIVYYLLLLLLSIYTYGYIDHNLPFSSNHLFLSLQKPLDTLIYNKSIWAGLLYFLLIMGLLLFYILCLKKVVLYTEISKNPVRFFSLVSIILFFSFPAFTYDIFNYMLTAKVAFVHWENPYLIMPNEIPNEPWLQFTRATNKVALYGPTWLFLTWIPITVGLGHIALTIYAFKILPLAGYIVMLYLINNITKDLRNVIFFGLNPLVLVEVLVSSHNDIVMMVLVLLAVQMIASKKLSERYFGWICYGLSIFIKGATLVLLPLFLLKKVTKPTWFVYAFWLMLGVFFITPLREELYPWYAVWFITFAACLPLKKMGFIQLITIALSVGLSLRHIPYIVTRDYLPDGPMQRLILTFSPPIMLFLYIGYDKWLKVKNK